MSVAIEWLHGRPHKNPEEDEDSAIEAAEAVFDRHGVTAEAAGAEYKAQWLALDDEAPMTGLALVWIEARNAADIAATEGWHNPEGGHVTICI